MKEIEKEIVNERISTTLETSDFYYELPKELIAQTPSAERDKCRLMVLDRKNQTVEHKIFSDIIDCLNPEDMLVVNSSKVILYLMIQKLPQKRSPFLRQFYVFSIRKSP